MQEPLEELKFMLVFQKNISKNLHDRGGVMNKKYLAPMIFKGGCDASVFNTWLKKVLLPVLAPGTTLVMDNASFLKGADTKRLIQEAKCHLLYLPTYSPDFNPIEHCWHNIKSRLKSFFHTQHELEILLGQSITKIC